MTWLQPPTSMHSLDDPMNAIVGRLFRQCLACEGQVADHRMKLTLQAYVEEARVDAVRLGLDPVEVDRVASHLTVNVW